MSVTSLVAFSIVESMDKPSLAFLVAIFKPRICAVIRSAIANPAASSAAELIFLPEERRSIAVARSLEDSASERCAFKEPMFVLTTILITDPCFFVLAAIWCLL